MNDPKLNQTDDTTDDHENGLPPKADAYEIGAEFSKPIHDGNIESVGNTIFSLNEVGDTDGIPNVTDAKRNNSAAKGAAIIFVGSLVVFGSFFTYRSIMKSKQQESVAAIKDDRVSSNKTLALSALQNNQTAMNTPETLEPLSDPSDITDPALADSSNQPPILVTQPEPIQEPSPPTQVFTPQVQPESESIAPVTVPTASTVSTVSTVSMPVVDPELTLDDKKFNAKLMASEGLTNHTNTSNSTSGAVNTSSNRLVASPSKRSDGKLGGFLKPLETTGNTASMAGDANLTIPKGTFIECLLETYLDTTVAGLTSCVVPRDIFSANGRVLLIEKGSKITGEYQNSVENGLNRIFVLWTRINTTNGVVIDIDSPSTDFLGGSGMAGKVNQHWGARFGNALLFSMIQDGFSYLANKNTNNSGVIYQNSKDSTQTIIEEAMKASGNIPPTLVKNQGSRIGIIISRDLNFGDVYELSAN